MNTVVSIHAVLESPSMGLARGVGRDPKTSGWVGVNGRQRWMGLKKERKEDGERGGANERGIWERRK